MQPAELPITSRQNELVKQARAARDGRRRNLLFIEGIRLCEEIPHSSLELEAVIYSNHLRHNARGWKAFEQLAPQAARVAEVTEEVFNSLSDTEVHQGLLALAQRPPTGRLPLVENPFWLVLHGLNNPSNAGALLRTAEAVGVNGVIATAGTTYLFAPKALRGSMGAAFRLPIWLGPTFEEVTAYCRQAGITTVCADIRGQNTHTFADWRRPAALVLGSEARGLQPEESGLIDEFVKIPMLPPVESLNVAVAAGVILYEAARQRRIF
jgi:TrmH family RNA methyltransferase